MADDLEIKITLSRDQIKQALAEHANDEKQAVNATVTAEQQKTNARKEAQIALHAILTDEQARRMAMNQQIDAGNQKRVASAVSALNKEAFANANVAGKIGIASTALLGMVGGYAGLAAIAGTTGVALLAMWKYQRDDIENSVDRITKYKEKILELAALSESLANPDPVHKELLGFRASTRQTEEEAIAFKQGAKNTGQASYGAGFISNEKGPNGEESQFDKLMRFAGEYQAATHADPTAIGELTGILPKAIGKQNQTAEEVFSRMAGIFETLQQGASDLGPAVRAFKENISLIGTGTLTTPEQLAAISSTYSVANAGREATLTQQLIRGTNLGQLKDTLEGGATRSSKSYLGSLGVTDQMNAAQIAERVAADVKKQVPVGKDGKPVDLNVQQYLAKNGYADAEVNKALSELVKTINTGEFGKNFAKRQSADSAPTFEAARAQTAGFATTAVGKARDTQLSEDIADTVKATDSETDYLNRKNQAFQELRAMPGSTTAGKFKEYNGKALWEGAILDRSKKDLMERASAAGVDLSDIEGRYGRGVANSFIKYTGQNLLTGALGLGGEDGVFGGSPAARTLYSNRERAEAYYDADRRIRAAQERSQKESIARGEKPTTDIARLNPSIENLTRALNDNTRATQDASKVAPGAATPQVPLPTRTGVPAVRSR